MLRSSFSMLLVLAFAFPVLATPNSDINVMDELNPFDPNIEQLLKQLDEEQEARTGMPSHIEGQSSRLHLWNNNSCFRDSCAVWAQVVKSRQKMYLYVNGVLDATYDVSTGAPGHTTPDFDTQPNGRIYDRYSSSKYPGGDYEGLGNMPYAVFISGGFAIHGTTQGNFPKLGSRASHGCIRLHPDNAQIFNRLVRTHGIDSVWITVQE